MIYEQIAERLRSTYALIYQTDRQLPDGTLRPVRIAYCASRQVGETAFYIPGMVVPAAGWSRLFLALVALLAVLAVLPGRLGVQGRVGQVGGDLSGGDPPRGRRVWDRPVLGVPVDEPLARPSATDARTSVGYVAEPGRSRRRDRFGLIRGGGLPRMSHACRGSQVRHGGQIRCRINPRLTPSHRLAQSL